MTRSLGITGKLSLWILAASVAVLLLVIGYNYTFTRGIVLRHIEKNAETLSLATVHRIESILQPVERCPRAVARILSAKPYGRGDADRILRSVLDNFPEIFGTTIAYDPASSGGPGERFSPYCYRVGEEIRYRDLAESYDYLQQEWYLAPRERGGPMWGEPYFDEGGGDIWMATFSVPIYQDAGGGREFVGVVTADISLDWLNDVVTGLKSSPTAFAVIVSRSGRILASSEGEEPRYRTITEMAEQTGDDRLLEIGEEMTAGRSGFVDVLSPETGEPRWVAYTPLLSGGWSLAISFPESEIMRDVSVMRRTGVFLALGGIALLLLVIVLVSRSITRPLRELAVKARSLGAGDLDSELPQVRSRDEVGRLTHAFSRMRGELKTHIAELTAATAERERLDADLRIAHDIQQSMVPDSFPRIPGVDVSAILRPAREVGGDFYDVFRVGPAEIAFLIGDVSGKGVAAALMMAVASTRLRTLGATESDPAMILGQVNRELATDNDACLFVTAFLCILNPDTGEVRYANAGHNEPLIVRADATAEFHPVDRTLPLGIIEETVYTNESLVLRPGEAILLYTDGVTEAFNAEHQALGEDRLRAGLSGRDLPTAKALVTAAESLVDSFVSGAPASDDLTALALRIGGPDPSKSQ